MGWLIVLGLIILIIYLVIRFVLPFLLFVLVVGGIIGLFAGTFYGIKNYMSSTNENISNKMFKILMMSITSIFILVLLGSLIFFNPFEQIISTVLPTNTHQTTTPVENAEVWTDRIVDSNGLNVRAGPSTDYDVRFVLHRNTVIKVSNRGVVGDWVKISHNDREGYVNGRFLRER